MGVLYAAIVTERGHTPKTLAGGPVAFLKAFPGVADIPSPSSSPRRIFGPISKCWARRGDGRNRRLRKGSTANLLKGERETVGAESSAIPGGDPLYGRTF